MTRYIDLEAAKKRVAGIKGYQRFGEIVVGEKAVAPVKGKEREGTVVFRRKVEYGAPFESKVNDR